MLDAGALVVAAGHAGMADGADAVVGDAGSRQYAGGACDGAVGQGQGPEGVVVAADVQGTTVDGDIARAKQGIDRPQSQGAT